MLVNYLKLSLRLLLRTPFISLVNISGLSLGFTTFVILWLYTQNELKTDRYHKDWDRIFRFGLITEWTDDKINWEQAIVGLNNIPLSKEISLDYEEVEELTTIVTPFYFGRAGAIQDVGHDKELFFSYLKPGSDKITFMESKVVYADTNLLTFFSIPLLHGDRRFVLSLPNDVILSEKTASRYFGNDDPLGKILQLNDSISLTVTGVFETLPHHTHLNFDIVISALRIQKTIAEKRIFGSCYFRLKHGSDAGALQKRINDDQGANITKVAWGGWPYGRAEVFFQPLSEISFDHFRGDLHNTKSKKVLTTLNIFSWVVLFVAWMNYVNLNISLNNKRMKELIARKSTGARAMDFIIQFIMEAVLIHIIALLFAFTLIQLIKVPIHEYLNIYLPKWKNIPSGSMVMLFVLLISSILLTSLYPAIASLKQQPKNLFGPLKYTKGEYRINHILTTLQFSLAIMLIILVFSTFLQNKYILQKDIGMNVDHVLIVDLPFDRTAGYIDKVATFQREVSRLHQIEGSTTSFSVAGNLAAKVIYLEKTLPGLSVETDGGVDENFISFFGIKMLAGRNFVPHAANGSSVILSKRAIERLGFKSPAEAVGAKLNTRWGPGVEIIGVIEDYKMRPFLSRTIEDDGYEGKPGLGLTYRDKYDPEATINTISFRIDSDKLQNIVGLIKQEYNQIFPGKMFNYSFLKERITGQYAEYTTALRQISVFTLLAIGIACLGLLGMMTNKVVQKTKEIGIRKVMGAALHQIGFLLLNRTIRQIVIAMIIGIPLAFVLIQKYLEEFSERTTLRWWHFALPVLILVAIMFTTIASVLWKAARSNPVEALKYE